MTLLSLQDTMGLGTETYESLPLTVFLALFIKKKRANLWVCHFDFPQCPMICEGIVEMKMMVFGSTVVPTMLLGPIVCIFILNRFYPYLLFLQTIAWMITRHGCLLRWGRIEGELNSLNLSQYHSSCSRVRLVDEK